VTVAVVTGAGSGIGRAIAVLLAQRGTNVIVADIDEGAARATAHQIGERAAPCRVDVAADASVGALVEFAVTRFGGLDWAVNNAGISPAAKPFTDHTLEEWQRVIDVNLTGVFLCLQHELRQMVLQGRGGSIVNIASGAGLVAAPGQPQYTAAKHGVLGLTKQAAQEFARAGVRVNAVLPGQTETAPMLAYLDAQPGLAERLAKTIPMGRMGTPAEVAQAVVWLCSDESSYVSGASLLVDGAQIAR
jgi:NAD(P)-dependent dehydrogenase (short-subunit alcohol dehydrogenase family)